MLRSRFVRVYCQKVTGPGKIVGIMSNELANFVILSILTIRVSCPTCRLIDRIRLIKVFGTPNSQELLFKRRVTAFQYRRPLFSGTSSPLLLENGRWPCLPRQRLLNNVWLTHINPISGDSTDIPKHRTYVAFELSSSWALSNNASMVSSEYVRDDASTANVLA